MNLKLKVKIKTLAAEARIIRAEEKKLKKRIKRAEERQVNTDNFQDLRASLHRHRTVDVRQHARHSQLAYAFLRGREYKNIEQPRKNNEASARLIIKDVARFTTDGPVDHGKIEKSVKEWLG